MKKQLICFILSILLCLNLVAPALANQSDSSAFLSKSGSTLVNSPVIPDISAERIETQKIELDSELNAWMVINIYSNATTDFFLVQDGEVLTSAHLDKKSQQVTETRYSNNKIIKQSTIT